MPKRLIITVVCFYLCAAFFVFAVLLSYGFAGGETPVWTVIVDITACITCLEIVVVGLRRLRRWAWITSIVLSGLIIVNGFIDGFSFVIGGFSLWGLLDKETLAVFLPRSVNE